jgi:hypothetical protein
MSRTATNLLPAISLSGSMCDVAHQGECRWSLATFHGLDTFITMNHEFSLDCWQRPAEEWEREQIPGLSRAVDKLVQFGEQVGVTPEEMLVLLDSGMTMRGLLYYLVSQSSPVN